MVLIYQGASSQSTISVLDKVQAKFIQNSNDKWVQAAFRRDLKALFNNSRNCDAVTMIAAYKQK